MFVLQDEAVLLKQKPGEDVTLGAMFCGGVPRFDQCRLCLTDSIQSLMLLILTIVKGQIFGIEIMSADEQNEHLPMVSDALARANINIEAVIDAAIYKYKQNSNEASALSNPDVIQAFDGIKGELAKSLAETILVREKEFDSIRQKIISEKHAEEIENERLNRKLKEKAAEANFDEKSNAINALGNYKVFASVAVFSAVVFIVGSWIGQAFLAFLFSVFLLLLYFSLLRKDVVSSLVEKADKIRLH